jgi:hypothetical protein
VKPKTQTAAQSGIAIAYMEGGVGRAKYVLDENDLNRQRGTMHSY